MNPTQPTSPSFNLYEELPEPIFQEMKQRVPSFFAIERKERLIFNLIRSLEMAKSQEERDNIQKTIDDLINPTFKDLKKKEEERLKEFGLACSTLSGIEYHDWSQNFFNMKQRDKEKDEIQRGRDDILNLLEEENPTNLTDIDRF